MNIHRRAQANAAIMSSADAAECAAFLLENPAVQYIDCVFADLCGAVRGKRVARSDLEGIYGAGLPIPASIYFLDARGDAIEPLSADLSGAGLGGIAWPVAGTLSRVSWSQRPHAQVLMTLHHPSGEHFFGEPRQVLRRVIQRLTDIDVAANIGTSLEFHLTGRDREKSGPAQPPADGSDLDEILDDISDATMVQGLPALAPLPLSAVDQFRIDLKPSGDAVSAGDHAVFARQVVRAAARRHGLDATCMAKPYLDHAGNGMQFHIGLVDGEGQCLFDDGTHRGSELLRHAIGGLQALMAESFALFAPNPNSYRRFAPKAAAARNKRWGVNSPTANISVSGNAGKPRQISHRVSGSDANPYLAIAAILAGIHHGIGNQLDPGTPIEIDATTFIDQTLPFTFDTALLTLKNGSILREYLGPDYVDLYCLAKRTELERFRNYIPPHEYDWYM